MGFVVFNKEYVSVYGVYEDENEAFDIVNNLNEISNSKNNIILEGTINMKEDSKFHFSEEDNDIDEEYYDALKVENFNYTKLMEESENLQVEITKLMKESNNLKEENTKLMEEYNNLKKDKENDKYISIILLLISLWRLSITVHKYFQEF